MPIHDHTWSVLRLGQFCQVFLHYLFTKDFSRSAVPVAVVSSQKVCYSARVSAEPIFTSISSRGTLSLPVAIRRKLKLDAPGAQLEVTLRGDNVIELRPYVAIPADQAWYWTPEWQAGEAEATSQIARGEGRVFLTDEEFLASFAENR